MKLLRGTRDGMSADAFHNKCNNRGPTITLIKNEKGYIFGGYSAIEWNNYGNYKSASASFIFTLTNMYDIAPTKFNNSDTSYSIYDASNYGPTFGGGHDIMVQFSSGNYTNFPSSYSFMFGRAKENKFTESNRINVKIFLIKSPWIRIIPHLSAEIIENITAGPFLALKNCKILVGTILMEASFIQRMNI